VSRRLAGRPRAVRRTWTDVLSTTLTVTRPLLSVQELAQCFGVSKQAAWHWVKLGRLRARRSRRDGVLRVSRSELARFAQRTHKRVPLGR